MLLLPNLKKDRVLLAVAALLLMSGMCALIYQISWIRAFRSFFGVSTRASGAVMAIFMAGLGLGAFILGPRADRSAKPLRFYALLEAGICLSAMMSYFLLGWARDIYLSLGGIQELGEVAATFIRLGLSCLVIGLPTFLMGGTLPAVCRAVTSASDIHRGGAGFLYGANAIGAFVGGLFAAFWLLEHLGVSGSLFGAVCLNALAAAIAWKLGGLTIFRGAEVARDPVITLPSVPRNAILIAAFLTGFVFLLQELVWYRMLSPLLGGSTYTMSMILCAALLGMGIGGALYPSFARLFPPRPGSFALTCATEALLLGIPFGLGDHFALWVTTLGGGSFGNLIVAWTLVVMVVVFPASLIAGIQFPLLFGMLGEGHQSLGRDIGRATLLNSGGAILGSLSGGFGLMMLLSAVGTWRLVILCLCLMVVLALLVGRRSGFCHGSQMGLVLLVPALFCAFLSGPGSPWRHSGIGVGRSGLSSMHPNAIQDWLNLNRREIIWEQDGVESSVGISNLDSIAFLVNGKTDGNAIGDAPTQIMSGLIGAALHPAPKRALVIGLGTGSTAGWLAELPTMEQVDVVELEGSVLEVARLSAAVNHDVLEHEKVRVILGDAREFLMTTNQRYDLIFSEPSNPYRAGVASLYTREYYQAAREHLREDGIFLQWLQGYAVDELSVQRVYSTLHYVFPELETWMPGNRDFILAASMEARTLDAVEMRDRLASEPFHSGMLHTWRVQGLEGFLSRFYGGEAYTNQMAVLPPELHNTDDQPFIEYAMARSLARGLYEPYAYLQDTTAMERRPKLVNGEHIRWQWVDENRVTITGDGLDLGKAFYDGAGFEGSYDRVRAMLLWLNLERSERDYVQKMERAIGLLNQSGSTAHMRDELLLMGEWASLTGSEEALRIAEQVSLVSQTEADVLRAMYYGPKDVKTATDHLIRAFEGHRIDPWPQRSLFKAALMLVPWLAEQSPAAARRLWTALEKPFAVASLNYHRQGVMAMIAGEVGYNESVMAFFHDMEPHVPWNDTFLEQRYKCYAAMSDPLEKDAQKDLEAFREAALKIY